MTRCVKVGIDVGGTFTHAVGLDAENLRLLGKVRVPTTHDAGEGVALGVVRSLEALLAQGHFTADEILLVAHSTTQATNALLEGDTAPVGILAMGAGWEGRLAARQARLGEVVIAPGRALNTHFRYLDLREGLDVDRVVHALEGLHEEGAQVFVATEAFGVDHPENEQTVVEVARGRGFLATSASRISRLYGMRARTRTAVLNASMLPRMLETAERTEKALRSLGIDAPLMVMRSDGGVMDVHEMKRRPILTMLSGPAAGVAAALMYVKLSDAVFVEVGGTSTDISVIKNGRPQLRSAQIGGYRLYLQTLDVRTVGVAGGSIPRARHGQLIDVGPRSAHIAGLAYAAFTERNSLEGLRVALDSPLPGDPPDHLFLAGEDSSRSSVALTPTCAARWLEDDGESKSPFLREAFTKAGVSLGLEARALAREVLSVAARKLAPTLRQLIREYGLAGGRARLVGGGGGAAALVPAVARELGLPWKTAENAEVLSAIGVALGMIRETVERHVLDPTEADVLALRQEAADSVVAMGALPQTVEVVVEIDGPAKKVRAVASGAGELRRRDDDYRNLSEEELLKRSADSLEAPVEAVRMEARTRFLRVVTHCVDQRWLFGLLHKQCRPVRVIDVEGVLRLQLHHGHVFTTTARGAEGVLQEQLREATSYGDAGMLLPGVFLLISAKVVDLGGLVTASQILNLAATELAAVPPDEPVVLLLSPR